MKQQYLILIALWVGWCVLHSVMISMPVLQAVRRVHSGVRHYYRLFYNLISVATFVPVLVYALGLEKEWVWRWEGPWRFVPWVLLAASAALFIGGARHYDMRQFLGLRQLEKRHSGRGMTESGHIDTTGMLGIVRHPWYTGGIVFLWATDLSKARLISNVILTVYLIVGAFVEERKLVREYGDEYRDYQERVPMLLPVGFFRRAGSDT